MTTTQKHRNFVGEPVVGQYLALDKDEARFKAWIQDSSSANSKQQNDCYTSVKEWCENHVQ